MSENGGFWSLSEKNTIMWKNDYLIYFKHSVHTGYRGLHKWFHFLWHRPNSAPLVAMSLSPFPLIRPQAGTCILWCLVVLGLVLPPLLPLPWMDWLFNFPWKPLKLFPSNFTWLTYVHGKIFGHMLVTLTQVHAATKVVTILPCLNLRTTYPVITKLGSHSPLRWQKMISPSNWPF